MRDADRERRRQEVLERQRQYRTYMRMSARALEIPLAVLVGLGLGMYLDRTFETAPWGKWLGLGFGVVTSCRYIYRLIQDQKKMDAAEDARTAAEQAATERARNAP